MHEELKKVFKNSKKKILQDGIGNNYVIMIPVFYEYEDRPAWRIVFKGTEEECEKEFYSFPDYLNATHEENKENRKNMFELYKFFISTHAYEDAEKIKKQYHF